MGRFAGDGPSTSARCTLSSSSSDACLRLGRRTYGACERSSLVSGRSSNCRKRGEWKGSGRGARSGTALVIGCAWGGGLVDADESVGLGGTAGGVSCLFWVRGEGCGAYSLRRAECRR